MLRIPIALSSKWLLAVAFTAGVAVTWWIGALVYDARVTKLKAQREQAVLEAVTVQAKEFNKQKVLTDDLNRKNASLIHDLDSRLRAAKRLRPNTCTPVSVRPSSPAGGDTGETQADLHGQGGGVAAYDLLDLAHDADRATVDQNTCVEFLDLIYKNNRN